jgi:hypothetical protein
LEPVASHAAISPCKTITRARPCSSGVCASGCSSPKGRLRHFHESSLISGVGEMSVIKTR